MPNDRMKSYTSSQMEQRRKESEARKAAEAAKTQEGINAAAIQKQREEAAANAAAAAVAAQKSKEEAAFNINTAATEAAAAKQKAISEAGSTAATQAQKSAYAAQQALIDKLTKQASGQAPSLAEAQIKATGEKNLAQQLAAAGAARGGNAAALQRQLAKQQQTMGAELTQQAGQAKLQEQQQNTAALQTAVAQQANMAQEAQNIYLSAYQNAIAQGFSVEQAKTQANVAYQEYMTQQSQFEKQQAQELELAKMGIASQQYMQKKQFQQQMIGSFINAVSGGLAGSLGFKDGGVVKSDRRVKKNISSADKDLKDFFESIGNKNVEHFKNSGVAGWGSSSLHLGDEEESNEPSFFKSNTIDFNKDADENIKAEEGNKIDWKKLGLSALKGVKSSAASYGSSSNLGGTINTNSKAQILKPKALKTFAMGGVPGLESIPSIGGGKEDEDDKKNKMIAMALKAAPMIIKAIGSDRNIKENIDNSDIEIEKFLNALKAYKYDYKNPNTPFTSEGKQFSVMAQDLEKTPVGKAMVEEDEDGTKLVNYAKGFGAILAAQANLNKRLSELEDKKKKSNKK